MKSIIKTTILLMTFFSSVVMAASGQKESATLGKTANYKQNLIRSVVSVNAVPTPTQTFHVSYDLPAGYPNKGTDGRNAVGGTVYVYTSNADGKIRKPIILPEAFDPEDVRGWDSLYNRMNVLNTLECLRTLGYDFIVINYDEGGNFIEHNAFLLEKVIEWVNGVKITPEKNVVFGPSMGGLVARYALAYMEKNNINHDTRLFISFDAPQYGANVPLGLQYMVRYWNDRVGGDDATKAYKTLKVPAARQMILYHIVNSLETKNIGPDPLRYSFDQNLHALGDWPVKLRKVAISNGSGNGLLQLKNDNVTRLQPGDKILDFDDGPAIFSRVWAVPEVTSTRIARCKTFFDADPDNYTVSGTRPYDNMPGGFRAFTGDLKGISNTADADKQCFIPTFSALAISTGENYYAPRNDAAVMSKTPFDALYYPVENQGHVVITQENKDWIFNEIMPANLNVATTFLPKGNIDIQASMEIHLLPGFATSTNPTFHIFVKSFGRCNLAGPLEATDENSSDVSTSIETVENVSGEISVYPNPASDFIMITAQGQELKQIEFMQADGKLLKTIQPQQGNYQLNLDDVHAGMYFIRVAGSKENVVKKIVVTR